MNKKMTFKMKVLRFTKKYKKHTTRHTLMAIAVILFLLVALPAGRFLLTQKEILAANDPNTFTASFVGDMNFNSYYDESVVKGRSEKISRYLNGYLETSDYVTGNIIGSITDKETSLLKDFNFSIVNIFKETENDMKILDQNGIIYVGTDLIADKKIVYKDMKGIKVAEIGTSEGRYVADLQWINQAKINADMVIVNVNWKDQFDTHVSDNQRSIAKAIGDAGADIILGHNTEVLQPIEIYNNTIIMYSLGNFLHGQIYSITEDSALIQYSINQEDSSKMLKVIPLSLIYGRPQPALSFLEGVNRYNIFEILTRELPENVTWTDENGILKIMLH